MPTFVVGSGVGDNYGVVVLPVVDVDWFKRALFGALFELTVSSNWLEMGDVAVSFAIEEAAQMIDGYAFMNFNPFPVGLILPFGSDVAPNGYLLCDGGSYGTVQYPELFTVIGYTYGGSDDSFNVPNMFNRVAVGSGGDFDIGVQGGESSHTLTEGEIPSHAHTIGATVTTLTLEPGEVTTLTPIPFIDAFTGNTGGDEPHNNLQPFTALNYCIYAGRI